MRETVWIFFLCLCSYSSGTDICEQMNQCSSHGNCNRFLKVCECFDGFGSKTEKESKILVSPIAVDCSERVCPAGNAWTDLPNSFDYPDNPVHGRIVECSNVGTCDRTKGECICPEGFFGEACQRIGCFSSVSETVPCSGKGQCVDLETMSQRADAMPISDEVDFIYRNNLAQKIWEANMVMGCICESTWEVGLEEGQKQIPQYFGPTCAMQHCPSGRDPMSDIDETDCENKKTG